MTNAEGESQTGALSLLEFVMNAHYEKPKTSLSLFGKTYICDHKLYTYCTLYEAHGVGLAVIQQRFDPVTKTTYWGEIDDYLVDDIHKQPGFREFFEMHARPRHGYIYPTVTVRSLMYALHMRPLKKEDWETVFDHPIGG